MQATSTIQPLRPVSDLIRQARQGVQRRRVDEIARRISLTDKDMARVLNISVRSLHGKQANEALSLAAGERLLLFENLVQRALSVFDGRADVVNRWLHTPLSELAYGEATQETTLRVPTRQLGSFEPPTTPVGKTVDSVAKENSPPFGPVAQSPLAVLDTVSGFSLANDVLGRIEWGIVG